MGQVDRGAADLLEQPRPFAAGTGAFAPHLAEGVFRGLVMLVGREPVFLVTGQESLDSAGILPHPIERRGQLLIEPHVGFRLVLGNRIFLDARASTWRIFGQSGRPWFRSDSSCWCDCSAEASVPRAIAPVTCEFWLK